jgi:hypothetical protein
VVNTGTCKLSASSVIADGKYRIAERFEPSCGHAW